MSSSFLCQRLLLIKLFCHFGHSPSCRHQVLFEKSFQNASNITSISYEYDHKHPLSQSGWSKMYLLQCSKLTRLLKDGLSGNSRTVMVATVSSSADQYHHTTNTLKYADRAKEIKTHIQVWGAIILITTIRKQNISFNIMSLLHYYVAKKI